jgi:hypothetical protein
VNVNITTQFLFYFFPFFLFSSLSSLPSWEWMEWWIWRMCAKLVCVGLLIWMNVSIKYLKPKLVKNLMCFYYVALATVRLSFLVIIIHGKLKRRIKYVFWFFFEKVKNKNVFFKKRYGIQHVLDFIVNLSFQGFEQQKM